jgi:hypothetical protein
MHFEIVEDEKVSLGAKFHVYFSIGNKGVWKAPYQPSFFALTIRGALVSKVHAQNTAVYPYSIAHLAFANRWNQDLYSG